MSYDLQNNVGSLWPVLKKVGLGLHDFAVLCAVSRRQNGETWNKIRSGEISIDSPEAWENSCFVAVPRLSFEAASSEREVQYSLKHLAKVGIIASKPGGPNGTVYHSIIPKKLAEWIEMIPAAEAEWTAEKRKKKKKKKLAKATDDEPIEVEEHAEVVVVEATQETAAPFPAPTKQESSDETITRYMNNGIPAEPDTAVHPTIRLGVVLYNLLGRPCSWMDAKAFHLQCKALKPLCETVGVERVHNVMVYGFNDDYFWASKLPGRDAAYFAEKYPKVESNFLGWLAKQERTASAPSAPTPAAADRVTRTQDEAIANYLNQFPNRAKERAA